MSKSLTFKKFSAAVRIRGKIFEEKIFKTGPWTESDYGCALGGEVGELQNFIKKRRRINYKGNKYKKECKHEIADVLIYLDTVANSLGFTLEECVIEKFNLTSKKNKINIFL